MTTARMSGRCDASRAAARISSCTCAFMAFIGGRSNRIVPTAPSTSRVTNVVLRAPVDSVMRGGYLGETVPMETWPGDPSPLGATWDGEGTNFALWAPAAESVALCLFDEGGTEQRV